MLQSRRAPLPQEEVAIRAHGLSLCIVSNWDIGLHERLGDLRPHEH